MESLVAVFFTFILCMIIAISLNARSQRRTTKIHHFDKHSVENLYLSEDDHHNNGHHHCHMDRGCGIDCSQSDSFFDSGNHHSSFDCGNSDCGSSGSSDCGGGF